MRIFYFFIFFLLTQNGFAQEIKWLTPQSFEFGYIPQGKPVRTAFKFRNIGKDSIQVELVRTTCGCTSPQWPSKAIAPGEVGVIELEYDAYKLGSFRKRARVFFVGYRRGNRLTILGEVN